jgi:tRNA(fMet)-specific endonuclease VapC
MGDVYLLDTNMLGPFADDRPEGEVQENTRRFREHLRATRDARFAISAITVGEIEWGLRSAPPHFPPEKEKEIRRIVASFDLVFDVSRATAAGAYGSARASLFAKYAPKTERRRRGRARHIEDLLEMPGAKPLGIQENDLWIASVAMEHNLVLLSGDNNLQHIKGVCPNLHLENWLEP